MKRALLGLGVVAAIATSVILWVFAAIDRDQLAYFEQEVERVQWGVLSESELLATWWCGADSLTLERGGRCRHVFGFWDEDLLASEERRGSWEVTSDVLAVRCEKAPSSYRSGHQEGRAVLVSEGRIWRRQSY